MDGVWSVNWIYGTLRWIAVSFRATVICVFVFTIFLIEVNAFVASMLYVLCFWYVSCLSSVQCWCYVTTGGRQRYKHENTDRSITEGTAVDGRVGRNM
jgi:hypothetical protein